MVNDGNDFARLVENHKAEIERCLDYRLTSDEVALIRQVDADFRRSLAEAFGERADIALTNIASSHLARMLLGEYDGYAVFNTVNDWLRSACEECGGRAFKLIPGYPDEDITGYVGVKRGQAA